MSSYYDNELVSHMKTIKIGDVTIISQIDNNTELMMENFQFKNGRVCFTEKQNKKYIMSSSSLISCDVISFINELIQENIFELNEKIVSAAIVGIYVVSTLIGGMIIGKLTKSKRYLWGMVLGIIYFVLLLLITLGVYRTLNGDSVSIVTSLILCAGGGMTGGMIS